MDIGPSIWTVLALMGVSRQLPQAGFHSDINSIQVGGVMSPLRLLLNFFFFLNLKFCPHCRSCLLLTAVSVPVLVCRYCFSGRSQQQEMEPLLGPPAGPPGGQTGKVLGSQEGRRGGQREQRVMGL